MCVRQCDKHYVSQVSRKSRAHMPRTSCHLYTKQTYICTCSQQGIVWRGGNGRAPVSAPSKFSPQFDCCRWMWQSSCSSTKNCASNQWEISLKPALHNNQHEFVIYIYTYFYFHICLYLTAYNVYVLLHLSRGNRNFSRLDLLRNLRQSA